MPNKNKNKDSQEKNFPEKIGYTIKTMNSDLKNEGFSRSSFKLSQKQKPILKKEKIIQEKIETKKEPFEKKISSPFLKEITPNAKNIYSELTKNTPELEKKAPQIPQKKPIPSVIKKKDFSRDKTISSILEKVPEEKILINNKLLITLFFVSLAALGSSLYYFYFIKDPSISPPLETTPPEIIPPKISEPEKNYLPAKLKNSETLTLEAETDLISLLLEKKISIPDNSGRYYKIKKTENFLSAKELLQLLTFQFPDEVLAELETAWISLYSQKNVLKMSLIIKTEETSTAISSFLEKNEYRLPEILKPLFIDETFVLQDKKTSFQKSGLIENIRFFNFAVDANDKSIDWGITKEGYLILSTSKDATLNLIEDLKNEEDLLEILDKTDLEIPQN